MYESAEVAVVGLGAMGSSALYYLTRNSVDTVGIDQYSPPHSSGSSHGETRLIRTAYFEHSNYVPLLQEATSEWLSLNDNFADNVFIQNGLLLAGDPKNSTILKGTRQSASEYNLPLETISTQMLKEKFSQFDFPVGTEGVFEAGAGYLLPEKAIGCFLQESKKNGANIFTNDQVVRYILNKNHIELVTLHKKIRVKKVIWTCGPWSPKMVPGWKDSMTLYRMLLHWFAVKNSSEIDYTRIPCFGYDQGKRFFYGFPSLDGKTIKIADHTAEVAIPTPEDCDRNILERESDVVRAFANSLFRNDIHGRHRSEACIYTMSHDEHFYIDQHPDDSRMVVACGFSGHGFKFSPVIGRNLANWCALGHLSDRLDFLSRKRLPN